MKNQALVCLGVVLICGACDSNDVRTGTETSTAGATSTTVTATGFDPCTDIDDSTIIRIGLDPATKKPSDAAIAFKYPGCTFLNTNKSVSIMVGLGRTFEEQKDRFSETAEFMSINGRESLISPPDKDDKTACSTALRLKDGVLFISQQISTKGRLAGVPGCERAAEIANAIEPLLPKGI